MEGKGRFASVGGAISKEPGGACSPPPYLLGQLWQSAWISIGQFPPRRGRGWHADTIVGINPLSSVLCVQPQIPISLHNRLPSFLPHDRSTHLNASYDYNFRNPSFGFLQLRFSARRISHVMADDGGDATVPRKSQKEGPASGPRQHWRSRQQRRRSTRSCWLMLSATARRTAAAVARLRSCLSSLDC